MSLHGVETKKTTMKKRYTKKQIMESIRFWKKQLNMMNESQYSSLIKINVYDVKFLDAGSETDIAQREYNNVQFNVDLNKSITKQIEDWFDVNVGTLPLSYRFKTIDVVKCNDYDELKNGIDF